MTNIPVFLASDDNYAPFVASTIASVCDNTKSFIDFYILDGGITKQNQERITKLKDKFDNFSLEFLEIDAEKEFKDFTTAKTISLSTYNRFLIPQLKPELDRALYSDVDVILLGDIAEMYHEDLNGHVLGAIWEEYAETSNNIKRKENLKLSAEHKYFSAGNLLIDCKKWRENNITEKLFTTEKKYRDILMFADQDVLNLEFDNKFQQLSKRYCYVTQDFCYYTDHNDILIRHYNCAIKPWHISPNTQNSLMPHLKEFWYYLEMTDFYDEVLAKTQNDAEQKKNLLNLKVQKMVHTKQHAPKA